ncbi:glycosyltransferase family 4 protein [Winogradskyella sp. MH6]|uniref:glycosyltransferase family 4 protein n=1 Tax=Winogradskyella sp. MH6 TaxID=2929510 RepID=UPI001FB3880F|nr:glycosyltransferase family 4 protein [Winogradskyella sp. MH6]
MINSIQIIDSLDVGGAERVAVNYANGLLGFVNSSHICVTRKEGPLKPSIEKQVGYVFLNKKSRLDISAILKLRKYITSKKINLIHAHSSSFFIAFLIKLTLPRIKIVWHDHYGKSEFLSSRPKFSLKIASIFFDQIFSVNQKLKQWSIDNLFCNKVDYIKNFPVLKNSNSDTTKIYGNEGKRIVCLANLREQKNHLQLLNAFKIVVEHYPDWTLHCVGKNFGDDYSKIFFNRIDALELKNNVFFYDSKKDILNILNQMDIAVLVSKSEGLPLALLEYGLSNLPVICTNVGDCGKLIPDITYGVLLDDDNATLIAKEIIGLIENKDFRQKISIAFNKKIIEEYSEEKILVDILNKYNLILKS